jgi:hypothetical protein
MKQYRVTTQDLSQSDNTDCYLSPDDPIHQLMPSSMMGGLGSEQALAQYRTLQLPSIQGSDKGQIAREQNIKPGTDAWFKHWFGKTQ